MKLPHFDSPNYQDFKKELNHWTTFAPEEASIGILPCILTCLSLQRTLQEYSCGGLEALCIDQMYAGGAHSKAKCVFIPHPHLWLKAKM